MKTVFLWNFCTNCGWASSLWWYVKMTISQQVRQSEEPQFQELLNYFEKRTFHNTRTLLLWLTAYLYGAYKRIRRWCTTGSIQDVDLIQLFITLLNTLVDTHNNSGITYFSVDKVIMFSSTTLEPHTWKNELHENPVSEIYDVLFSTRQWGLLTFSSSKWVCHLWLNTLFPNLFNEKMFLLKIFTRALKLGFIDDHCRQKNFLSCITFKLSFRALNITILQLSVWVTFAITAHKVQGETIKKVVVDLRSPFFSPGQFNVAICRVRKASDFLLLYRPVDTVHAWSAGHLMHVTGANPVFKETVDLFESIQSS